MARHYVSAVLLATVWLLCCLPTVIYAQTRGMGLITTATINSNYAQSTGYVFGSDNTGNRALVAVGNNLFAVPYDNPSSMGNPILQTIENDDQIVGAFYDNVNGSIFVCTRYYRRIYWLSNFNGQGNPQAVVSIRNRGQTGYRYWNACALDRDQKGIWVAADTEVGYYRNVYQSDSSSNYASTDVYGYAQYLKALVIMNGNVVLGGSSGNIFITSVQNTGLNANYFSRITRGVGQIQTMDSSASLNKIYIGGDLGVLTEIDASSYAFTRISFVDDANILSMQVDDTYSAIFINAISRSTPVTSRIIRINLNDANFDTFGVFSFPSGITVNTGDLDTRNGKFQLLYVNSAGDTISTVRTASCTDYTCTTCNSDTNYCGYCSSSRACVLPTACSSQNFFTSTYICPTLTSISPSSGSTDGGTVVTVTGQFTDPAGNTLTSGFECQWGSGSRVSATVVNGVTLRCTSPSTGSAGDTTFKVYYGGSLWTPNSVTFTYYNCASLTTTNPCASCFSLSECGICIPTMQCASQKGCTNGFSTSCPVISNISPASASIVGNNNFTITIDKNINANYQCVYSSSSTTIANTATPATLIRSNTLTCKPPAVTNWNAARGSNRELNVDLVLRVGSNPAVLASKSKAIYLFDCDTYGQDCSGCTNSLTQGECAFCFDLQECHYSSVQCTKTGTCPSISSVSPPRIYLGAVASQVMTIAGRFSFLSGQTFYCAYGAVGDSMGSNITPGTYVSSTSITCNLYSGLGVGTQSVSLWLYSSITSTYSRVVPNFSFDIYSCTGTSCTTCLDGTKPECVFCSSTATCAHTSATCTNTKLTSSASCPSISAVSPTSVSKTGNATIAITGPFDPTPLSGSVSCLWSYGGSVTTPATYSAANEVHCTAPAVNAANTGTVALSYNGNVWTNSLPFLWYDCAQITGDCSKCITDVTPKCTWCTSGCDEVCSDPELKTDVCPSLTSVTPNYGYVLGGETVSVNGGPFFSRTNFTYECRFGDKVSPAVVQSINVLSCTTPASLLTQKVNLTIWMNGINYAPFSAVEFAYYECQTFAQTSCNSFCMAQPHCGWCVASSSCTSASRCSAVDDLFLTECLSVTPSPNHMSIFGNSNITLTFTPRLPDFLLLNSSVVTNLTGIDTPPSSVDAPVDASPVSAKRGLFQTVSESLLTCSVGGFSQVPAYITGLNTVACSLPASGAASQVSLGVLYKGSNLLTPIQFTYVDCEITTNCDDCSRKQYCGWCLQENSCSTLKRCSGDWANAGCPNLISITPDSASASGGSSLTLVGEYFINHPSIKILMGTDAAEYEFVNSTTMTVIVIPGTADDSVDISMMFNDKKYATNTLSFTWVSPFSVPGLAAGMSIAGALMIGGGVFYYLFTRYQKRRQGLFVQVKEPDYEKVAYQNEMVQHFRVTSKDDYVELEDILMNKDRTFLRILVAITAATEYDAVAKALVYLSHHKGIGSDLIQFFASDEVRKSTSENTIFRQNSMASKMFKFYSQIVGTRFLFFTLARVINELNTVAANAQKEKEKLEKMGADTTASLLTIEMEVDPNKLKDSNVDKDQNVYQLALACQKLFTAIAAADENVPAEFRQVFIRIQSSITEQYGDSEAIYKALGGFLFLRFVCPAITAPHYYGLLREPPNSIAQRQLVLIAKVLQNLANLANTKKEAFMESMLDFIERNKPKMIQYYKSLLNPEAKANPRMATNLAVPATVRENSLAYLHTHIYRNQQKIKLALTELPDQMRAKQLSTLVDRIIEKYGEPPKRLKDKGGPVRSAPAEPMEKPEPKNVTINNPVAQVDKQASPRPQGGAETNTNEANNTNNRPVANRPSQAPQYGTARRNQFGTLREPFFDIADAEPVGNLLEDNVFTDTIVITEANMFDNPFDINFEPMANELDFEVFDNPLLENNVTDN